MSETRHQCALDSTLTKYADIDRLSFVLDGIKSFVIDAGLYKCDKCGKTWVAWRHENTPTNMEFRIIRRT